MKALIAVLATAFAALGAVWIRNMIDMPLQSHRGPLPALTDEERLVTASLRRHVYHLAGKIGERNMARGQALADAAAYIAESFEAAGIAPLRQEFDVGGVTTANIVAEIPGRGSPGEIVVAGAHYDSVRGSPGANDNASGVAALLETARLLAARAPLRTIRFIAFANEEPPFFQTDAMGSLVAARRSRRAGEDLTAVLSFETLGCYSDERGSQKYPPPLGLLYPDRGNFIAFVGNGPSAGLVRTCLAAFRSGTAFPSEGIAAPEAVPGVGWSDHWSYWQAGYRAIMVTDTAPYRYPHYHSAGDIPERIDYERTARVTVGLARVLAGLAGGDRREEP